MEVTRQVVKEGGRGPGSLSTVLRVAGGNNPGRLPDGAHGGPAPGFIHRLVFFYSGKGSIFSRY